MAVGIDSDPSYCDEHFEETDVKVKVCIIIVCIITLSRCVKGNNVAAINYLTNRIF